MFHAMEFDTDEVSFSLQNNFFSMLFLYSYFRAGIKPRRRILYAATLQCLRGMVTGCDNLLDTEFCFRVRGTSPTSSNRWDKNVWRRCMSVARAFAHRPNLDTATGLGIVTMMRHLETDHGCTVIMATHDSEIISVADVIISLKDGQIDKEGT